MQRFLRLLTGIALAVLIVSPFVARAEDLDPETYQSLSAQLKIIAEYVQQLAVQVLDFVKSRAVASLPSAPPSLVAPAAPSSAPTVDPFSGFSSALSNYGITLEMLTATSVVPAFNALGSSFYNTSYNLYESPGPTNPMPVIPPGPESSSTVAPLVTDGSVPPGAAPMVDSESKRLEQQIQEIYKILGIPNP